VEKKTLEEVEGLKHKRRKTTSPLKYKRRKTTSPLEHKRRNANVKVYILCIVFQGGSILRLLCSNGEVRLLCSNPLKFGSLFRIRDALFRKIKSYKKTAWVCLTGWCTKYTALLQLFTCVKWIFIQSTVLTMIK